MPHLTRTDLHQHLGEPYLVLIPVLDLEPADVTSATFRVLGDATTGVSLAGGGITVISGADAKTTYPDADDITDVPDTAAVLVVELDPDDSTAIGVGTWHWQARAGGDDPQAVAYGTFIVTRTIAAPA